MNSNKASLIEEMKAAGFSGEGLAVSTARKAARFVPLPGHKGPRGVCVLGCDCPECVLSFSAQERADYKLMQALDAEREAEAQMKQRIKAAKRAKKARPEPTSAAKIVAVGGTLYRMGASGKTLRRVAG